MILTPYKTEAMRWHDKRQAQRYARECRQEAPMMRFRVEEHGSRYMIVVDGDYERGWLHKDQSR